MNASTETARPSSLAKWWLFIWLCVVLFGNLYTYDSIGPIADILRTQLHFSSTQVGSLNAVYSLPNIVLVLFGGWLCDRVGVGRILILTAALCAIGALLVAVSHSYGVMLVGRLLFGIGAETMCVATWVGMALWFKGSWLALAMAANVGIGRLGSYTADMSPHLFAHAYATGWQAPMWISFAMSVGALVGALGCAYIMMRYGKTVNRTADISGAHAQPIKLDWQSFIRFDRSFWYLLILCMMFYSVVMVFRSTFAIEYFQNVNHLSLATAGQLNSYVFLTAVFVTPIFGWINDKIGRHGLLLAFGTLCALLAFVLLLSGEPDLSLVTIFLGICYSLVPAVLWPAVSFTVEPARLGIAYGVMDAMQNLGLTVVNLAAGGLNDDYQAGITNPSGYTPMIVMFTALSVIAFFAAILFWKRGLHVIKAQATVVS